jgi:SAM-dependent methyltransferase
MSEPTATCPLCSAEAQRIGRPARFTLFRCPACTHRFAKIPDGFDLGKAYSDKYAGFRPDERFLANLRRIYQEQLRPELPASAAVLDVGCGNGGTLTVARDAGHRPQGIDASAAAVELCQKQGLDAVAADFTTHDFGHAFDLVTFWDVLEHLPDPLKFLRRAAALAGSSGAVLVKVPGHVVLSVEIAARLPRLAGAVLQVPSHLHFFTHESLSQALAAAGLPRVRWLPCPALRTPYLGGSLRRSISWSVVHAIHDLSGDGGLLALARR